MMKRAMVFMGLGFELLGVVLGAAYLGQVIDDRYHLNGFGIAILVIVVMIGWMYHLFVLLKRFMNEGSSDHDGNDRHPK